MPRVGFQPPIPVSEQAKILHVLDRAAIVIGALKITFLNTGLLTEQSAHNSGPRTGALLGVSAATPIRTLAVLVTNTKLVDSSNETHKSYYRKTDEHFTQHSRTIQPSTQHLDS
jgi:hypothetical protein